jgi:hypothetical protein
MRGPRLEQPGAFDLNRGRIIQQPSDRRRRSGTCRPCRQ